MKAEKIRKEDIKATRDKEDTLNGINLRSTIPGIRRLKVQVSMEVQVTQKSKLTSQLNSQKVKLKR